MSGKGSFPTPRQETWFACSQHMMNGEWHHVLRYLIPLLAFAGGIFVAENIQERFRYAKRLHWRQGILLAEILILFVVGFLPRNLDMAATALVSFACAMQVQTFRKVHGYSYASTMCIGNLEVVLQRFLHGSEKRNQKSWKRQCITLPLLYSLQSEQASEAICLCITESPLSGYPVFCCSSALW